ncbi:uncharacterized protein ARMOST_09494 [Armillaria ostoyae]|uniref:DRBM domain-containing protein n=1 Tax=Armillaria ostoyae TaxID=47428 RepID=A0A284RBM9_ARMOS|nr:uncharacterized protein ARMOST_09494 [Armillaria ostoyae]
MDPPLPTLPTISGDYNIMLDVYTHSSARPTAGTLDPEYGNTERLAELGKRMLDLAVTYHYFHVKPHLSADDIAARKDEALSDDAIVRWIEGYELKNKIRAYPHTVLDDPNELRIFFHTFIGALYIRNGMNEVQDWISHLIDPTHEPAPIPSPPQMQQQQQTQGLPTQPSQPPPPIPPFNPSIPPPMAQTAPGLTSLITLQLIHQTAAQKGYAVTYGAQSEGPPHQPTWTVQCLFNGQVAGTGIARSQKLAREEAARQAWNASGWGPQA